MKIWIKTVSALYIKVFKVPAMGTGQNCTKKKLHKGTKLHKNNFAKITILHKLKFCTRVKKIRIKINIKNRKKTIRSINKKKKKKELFTEGKG